MDTQNEHIIILSQGREDGGHAATLAFKLAATMQAMNHKVSIFLTLSGTRWSFKHTGSDIQIPQEPSLEEYIDAFTECDGEILICSPCIAAYCYIPGVDEKAYEQTLRQNARYVGLATIAEKLFHGDATVF